jgi:secreted trypsin-like serine protease
MKIEITIFAFLAIASLGNSLNVTKDKEGRIVGGAAIDIRQAPYQVVLMASGRHICGGSIIARNFILTAAHCKRNLIKSILLLLLT